MQHDFGERNQHEKCLVCGAERHAVALSRIPFHCAGKEPSVALDDQPQPKTTDSPDCWLLVMEDMKKRRQFGIDKYGSPVQFDSGRDILVDLYQELLDACVYIRGEIEKRNRHAAQAHDPASRTEARPTDSRDGA